MIINPFTLRTDNEGILQSLIGRFVKVTDETSGVSWAVIGEVIGMDERSITIAAPFNDGIEIPLMDDHLVIECLQDTEV